MKKEIEEKKKELSGQLLMEMVRLAKQGRGVSDHKKAIEYLNTGNEFDGEGDLLSACINDFDCIYSDYCI